MKISVDSILPNPEQPRKQFNQVELKDLAESIRVNGLMNAIAVEEAGDGMYFIIDGERRWRAHKLIGIGEIEATVHPAQNGGSFDRLMKALVANMFRVDLTPIEEAQAYKRLIDMGKKVNAIAHYAGVSYPVITNRLKLLNLEPEVQDLINARKLPTDVKSTDALLSIKKPEDQVKMGLRLARPGIKIRTIVQACRQYNQILHTPKEKLDIPAVDMARKRVVRDVVKLPVWSLLQHLGKLPPWKLYQEAADMTCKNCSLADFASEDTCKECPAVELTRMLMERANERS